MIPVLFVLFIFFNIFICHFIRAQPLLTFNSQTILWPNSRNDLELTTGFIKDPQYELSLQIPIKSRSTKVFRPRSLAALHHARLRSLHNQESETVEWEELYVSGPDVEDRHTLSQLARMSGNAYALPGQRNWYEVDATWNQVRHAFVSKMWNPLLTRGQSFPFGWEDESDGFRGHVFISSDNSTIVLAIKGTTLNGPTSKKDKFNDNL